MNTILGLIHGLDYLLSSWLIGMFVFESWIATAAGETVRSRFDRSRKLSVILASALVVVSIIWFILVAADMAETWNPLDLFDVATSTRFGHIGVCKIGTVLAILIFTFANQLFRFWWIALVLPLCFGLSGHAGTEQTGIVINLILDTIHLTAVSVWTGGMITLLLWLKARPRSYTLLANASILVVTRFSHFAMISTALIGITGAVMALRFGVDTTSLFSTDYGKLIVAKITLFTMALAAASINQFVHIRNYSSEGEMDFTRSIYREVHIELAAVWLTFIVVGFLTRLPPPTMN